MTNMTTNTTPAPSSWSALVSIIDRPQTTFANLIAHPRRKWILPVVIGLVSVLVSVWASAPYSSELALQQMRQQFTETGLSPEQAEEQMAVAQNFASPLFIGLTGSIGGMLVVGILWLLTTTYFYFTALVSGAELKFGDVFLMSLWASLPLALRSIVQGLLILLTGNVAVYTSLAVLQTSGDAMQDATNPLLSLLSNIDPFWLWYLFLLVVGLAIVARMSKVKATIIVLIYALLAAGIGIVPTFIVGRV